MGILNEMFGDGESLPEVKEGELLAAGDYVSEKETMLTGYGIFRRKYVMKNLLLRLFIAGVALASSVFMIITSPTDDKVIPYMCLVMCVFVISWFIGQFNGNKKSYLKSLNSLSGIPYHVEIYTDKIKISDMSPIEESTEEVPQETEGDSPQEEENPATVIHLDSPIVDLMDKEDMFILVVKKSYLFIVPKSAFPQEAAQKVREKLSNIMGIRYKAG